MKEEKEFKVIQSAMQQALAAGLFKDFETVNIVQRALSDIGEALRELHDIKNKPVAHYPMAAEE